MKIEGRLTMGHDVRNSDSIFGVGVLLVKENSGRTVGDQTPIFHSTVRLARIISISMRMKALVHMMA